MNCGRMLLDLLIEHECFTHIELLARRYPYYVVERIITNKSLLQQLIHSLQK